MDLSPEGLKQYKKDKEKEKESFARWSWFAIVEVLSGGDVTKAEQVYKQNYVFCLDWLSYQKERDLLKARIENKK